MPTMAARKLMTQLLFSAPLIALLFLPAGALGAAATADNGTAAKDSSPSSSSQRGVFSPDRYGARGDGTHDDTQALAMAWKVACNSSRPAVVLVPGGKSYLLKVLRLSGPCRSNVTFTVEGTPVASPNRADWSDKDRRHWIVFRSVDKLTVNGTGTMDGNGETWWKNSCKINKAI